MRSRLPAIFVALVLVYTAACTRSMPAQSAPEPPRSSQLDVIALALQATGPTLPAALAATETAIRGERRTVGPDPFVPVVDPSWPCSQWLDMAIDVGWPVEQLPTLGYVMHRESRCDPTATGSLVCGAHGCARALGLTQLLGWSCPPGGCYDPASNMAKALELWRSSGWRPWCLAGDRVTGSC